MSNVILLILYLSAKRGGTKYFCTNLFPFPLFSSEGERKGEESEQNVTDFYFMTTVSNYKTDFLQMK